MKKEAPKIAKTTNTQSRYSISFSLGTISAPNNRSRKKNKRKRITRGPNKKKKKKSKRKKKTKSMIFPGLFLWLVALKPIMKVIAKDRIIFSIFFFHSTF